MATITNKKLNPDDVLVRVRHSERVFVYASVGELNAAKRKSKGRIIPRKDECFPQLDRGGVATHVWVSQKKLKELRSGHTN